jgi:hypothetical protein
MLLRLGAIRLTAEEARQLELRPYGVPRTSGQTGISESCDEQTIQTITKKGQAQSSSRGATSGTQ